MSHTILQTLAQNPMWVYERTYQYLLLRLPGQLIQGGQQGGRTNWNYGQVEFRVLERERYTLTLAANQKFSDMTPVPDVEFVVRMYQDLRVAEVLSYQGFSRSLPDNSSLATKLLQSVGKRQANLMFLEWFMSLPMNGLAADASELHCVED